jgi:hypothetical protein
MARRTTVEDVRSWLVAAGATPEEATTITETLGEAGLSPPGMRRWLKPDQNYPILDGWVADGVPWTLAAVFLIEDGKTSQVIAAARDFAAATPAERFISTAIGGGNLELHVRPLTRGDAHHAERVRRVIELLLAQLRTPTRVRGCLETTFGSGHGPEDMVRLVDCLLDDRFDAVLAALEEGTFDAWRHLRTGRYHGYGW